MRTDSRNTRFFPYVCHATFPARQEFFVGFAGVFWAVAMFAGARSFAPLGTGWEWTFYSAAALGAIAPFGAVLSAGYVDVLPNTVAVWRGATVVRPVLLSPSGVFVILTGALCAVVGVANTFLDGPLTVERVGLTGLLTGPGMLLYGLYTILVYPWERLRGIRMTPESFTYWRGFGRITLAWDELGDAISTNDVRDHEAKRKHEGLYLPGAKIVIPVERAAETRLPIWWEDDATPRVLLETGHFRVEPSALLTAILAMRDHPELRPVLGTRPSKKFFVGPPWRVRRYMYRAQQWWPKGSAPAGVAVDSDGVVKEFQ